MVPSAVGLGAESSVWVLTCVAEAEAKYRHYQRVDDSGLQFNERGHFAGRGDDRSMPEELVDDLGMENAIVEKRDGAALCD